MLYHFAEYQDLYTLADKISLRVPDLDALVENMNVLGYLIKKGPGMYQVKSSRSGLGPISYSIALGLNKMLFYTADS